VPEFQIFDIHYDVREGYRVCQDGEMAATLLWCRWVDTSTSFHLCRLEAWLLDDDASASC
jgi:hypothetical protein